MKYMLMICSDVSEMVPGEAEATAGCGGWSEEMERRGILQGGAGLRPSSDATTVRVRGDDVLLSDGPFAETKDQIGGFSLIECADLDEAVEVASKHPAARYGQIEVRPLWEP
ncbi:transcription initiation protein [Actinomadura sp. HBU206391]|nr:transcription initiation protein [Actinomadura sp. HBU206391]